MFTPAALSCIEFENVRDGITKSEVPDETSSPMPFVTRQLSGMKPPYNGMRLSAGAFAQLGEAASEFALSRVMGYASNQSGFYDPKFESMVLSASTEPDAGKRKVLYGQISDFLLDAAYCLVFSAYSNIMALRANVRGLRWEPSTAVAIREMWLA